MVIKHVIITGTGRTGTSFIVQILTVLGLDTGFKPDKIAIHRISRGGLESHNYEDSSYILKNPRFCYYAKDIFNRSNIQIEHIFVPIRNLYQAAESRRHVVKYRKDGTIVTVRGGLVGTSSMKRGVQEDELLKMIYNLMLDTSETFIPLTLINYPRLTKDSSYLYKKLKPILKDVSFKQFDSAFNSLIRPDWVHNFVETR